MTHDAHDAPPPFNPNFDPAAKGRSEEATRLIDIEEVQSGREWTLEERKQRRDEIYGALSEVAEVKQVLESLRKAGLCVCETRLIASHHPALMSDDLILTRIEESS